MSEVNPTPESPEEPIRAEQVFDDARKKRAQPQVLNAIVLGIVTTDTGKTVFKLQVGEEDEQFISTEVTASFEEVERYTDLLEKSKQ